MRHLKLSGEHSDTLGINEDRNRTRRLTMWKVKDKIKSLHSEFDKAVASEASGTTRKCQ